MEMEKRKHLFRILLVSIATGLTAVLLWFTVSLWAYDSIINPVQNVQNIEYEKLVAGMKEFHLDSECYFVSETTDPWISLNVKKERYRFLFLEIADIEGEIGDTQLFYSDKNEFTNDRKLSFQLHKGLNQIQLPNNQNFTYLRLDLTNQADVRIKIEKVALSYSNILIENKIYGIYMILFLLFLVCIWRYWVSKKSIWEICTAIVSSDHKSIRFVVVVVTGIFLAVYGKLIWNSSLYAYMDIGADTVNQYIPIIHKCISYVQSGKVTFWNYANICGSSNLSVSSFLTNPFLLFTVISGCIFGKQAVFWTLLISQYVQMVLGSVVCFKLLCLHKITNKANIAASIVFAFNGFTILWGQHYMFAIYPLMAICVIYLMERYLNTKNIKNYIALIAIIALCGLISVYMLYMILLTAGFYVLFCIAKKEGKKLFVIGKLLLAVMLGIGVSAVVFVPSAINLLFNSTRIISDIGLLEKVVSNLVNFYTIDEIKDISTRLLSNNLLGIGNNIDAYANYYEIPQLFFSCFSISIFIQYIFGIWCNKGTVLHKCLSFLACFLLIFLLYNKAGSLVYNGFVTAFGRYTFSIMPVFAIVYASALDHILEDNRCSYCGLIISSMLHGYLLLDAYGNAMETVKGNLRMIIAIHIAALFFFILFVAVKKSGTLKEIMYALFLLLLISDLYMDSHLTVCERGILSIDYYRQLEDGRNKVANIIDDIRNQDSGYYRIEKTFLNFSIGDPYMENYDGITGYNSSANKNFIEFKNDYMPGMYSYEAPYRPTYYSIRYQFDKCGLLGVKYILSDYALPDYSHLLTLMDVRDGYYIYQNRCFQSFQQFYDNTYNYEEFKGLSNREKTDILKNHIVVKDTDRKGMVNCSYNVTDQVVSNIVDHIVEFQNVSVLEDKEYLAASFSVQSDHNVGTNMTVYTTTGNIYNYMINTIRQTDYYFLLPQNVAKIEFANQDTLPYEIMDFHVYKDKVSDETGLAGVVFQDGDQLYGDIQTLKDGLVFLPIVYEDGWKLEIDGKPGKLVHADSGFMAFSLTKGKHSYRIYYQLPGLKIGICVSVMSLLGCISIVALRKISKQKDDVERIHV